MFRSALGEVKGVVDSRFLLTFFFPCLVLLGSVLLLVQLQRRTYDRTVAAWETESDNLKLVQIVGFLAVVTICAQILAAETPSLVRTYEGYWRRPFRFLLQPGRWYHGRVYDNLVKKMEKDEVYEQLYLSYPPPGRRNSVLPTTFGNVLKNAGNVPLRTVRNRCGSLLAAPVPTYYRRRL